MSHAHPIAQRILKATLLPIVHVFCWWIGIRLPNGALVVVPDFMATILLLIGISFFPPLLVDHPLGCLLAIFLSRFLFVSVLWVTPRSALYFKLLCLIPYWIHRVPSDARFDLYQAPDDAVPTGVAFESPQYRGRPLCMGTSLSAKSLYELIGSTIWRGE